METSSSSTSSKWIKLNIGGKIFNTTRSTIVDKEPHSMLARMFEQSQLSPADLDIDGAYLIDRSGEYFEPILNYLRNGKLVYNPNLNPEGILEEARFYGIESLVNILEQQIAANQPDPDPPLTRSDVISALIHTSHMSELRFQGVNLRNCDLRKLDLRHINFKYANMSGALLSHSNLSYCCLERADLSFANLEGAQLLSIKALCANFEGAFLKGCNFEDPIGVRSNLEGCCLKNACLEDSNMAGVNLREQIWKIVH
ncbi:BTB/POZ domain-containing protein KCTD9 isoform X2 [Culicoides brevitarsis]|uniref:BTB/POZ domain-containing protein KCTD9 isoform X2 n=1 Tax=Culicoides brevitarsis TaxID=469753 RepID=UPI00307C212E